MEAGGGGGVSRNQYSTKGDFDNNKIDCQLTAISGHHKNVTEPYEDLETNGPPSPSLN